MLEDYTRYLVSIRDNLIQCGVSFPVTPIEEYMDVLDLGAKLDSVLWYYSMLEISGSRKSLRGFLLPLGRCYLFEMRRRAYEEYKGIIATYDTLRVKPEKKEKVLESSSGTTEEMVYLLQYIGHGRYVEDIVQENHIDDAKPVLSSSEEENKELAELLYGSSDGTSYSSVGRYVEDIVSSEGTPVVDNDGFEVIDEHEVDENGFEVEEEPEVDENGFEVEEPEVDENGFEVAEEEESANDDTDDFFKRIFGELSSGSRVAVEDISSSGAESSEPRVDEFGFEIEEEPESVEKASEPLVDEFGFEIEEEPEVDENGFEVEEEPYTPEEPEVDEYGFEISDDEPEVDENGFEEEDDSYTVKDEEEETSEPMVDEFGFEIEDEPESVPVDDEDVFEEQEVDEFGFEISNDKPEVDENGFEVEDEEPSPVTQGTSSNDILDRLREPSTSVSAPAVPVKDFSDTLQEKTNEILTKGKRAVIRGIRRLEK